MSAGTYTVNAAVTLTITVTNPDAIERVTGPGGDEWRAQFYKLSSAADVMEHFTYNRLANGVEDVRRLDGWADLSEGDVTISVEYEDFELASVT